METYEHLIDPELPPLPDWRFIPLLDATTLETARAMSRTIGEQLGERIGVFRDAWITGRDGAPDLKLVICSRDGRTDVPRPAIYHIHAGGYVLGDADTFAPINGIRAQEHDAVVVSVDYRIAPESAFPEPIEDCYAGLLWLYAHASELGVDPARIVVMGESAGGGLAAALCLMARDRAEVTPAAQFLVYPMLDHRTGSENDPYRNPTTGHVTWTRQDNQFGWSAMRGSDPIPEERMGYFSPSLAADLAGLPPTFIATGALDLFLDENMDYALRLSRAGVPIELHVYPGAPHGFDSMDATISRNAVADRDRALARVFGAPKQV